MTRFCLIHNAKAGGSSRLADNLQRYVSQTGCDFRVADSPQQAQQQARQAVRDGVDRLLVAGGDGTVSQTVNAIAAESSDGIPPIEIAVLPMGTGNDLARTLDIPTNSIDDALQLAMEGPARTMDVIRLTDQKTTSYIVNAATGGVGGKVAADVSPTDKVRWGAFAYWITAVGELALVEALDIELTVDGQARRCQLYGLAVANGRYIGGGFPIAPRAMLNDHKLDITLMPEMSTMEMMAAGLDYMMGIAGDTDRVPTFQARSVTISGSPEISFSVDGEPVKKIAATFEIVPDALHIVPGDNPALCD